MNLTECSGTAGSPDEVVRHVLRAHERERAVLAKLTDEQTAAPSALPGWSRAHVLAARLVFVRAAQRQLDQARSGPRSEFYDGGRPGRESRISRLASGPPARLRHELAEATLGLDEGWRRVTPPEWHLPVAFRGPGELVEVLHGSWREVELHHVDLALGADSGTWPAALCVHLFGFLRPRVPEGLELRLNPADAAGRWSLGAGRPVEIYGTLTDLAAWLAGREPSGPVRAGTGELPVLGRLRDAGTR